MHVYNDVQNPELNNNWYCDVCKRAFNGNRGLAAHKRSAEHKRKAEEHGVKDKTQLFKDFLDNDRFTLYYKTSLSDFSYSEYTLVENDSTSSTLRSKDENYSFQKFNEILIKFMEVFKKSFKFQISCSAKYYKFNMFDEENQYQYCELFHSSKQVVITQTNQISDKVNEVQSFIREKVREAELRESGWNSMTYNNFKLHISRYNNNSGGSYV